MKILKWIKDLFSDQKKTTVSVTGNSIHKEKDVMNIEAENGDVKIENYHLSNLKGILVIMIVLLILIVIVIVIVASILAPIYGKKSDTEKNSNITNANKEQVFNNRYVYGNYDGLIRHDNSTTAFQKCDSEFYISLAERNKGNYVRVLVFSIESYFGDMNNYQSEDEKWNYIEDIYNAVCISLCTEYDCKLEKKTQDQWRYIESEKGVYFSASFFAGKKEFINSIVSDREKNNGQPWFVLQKCLYFGDYYIITVILTHDGTYGEFMKSDLKEDLRLKRCFQSFYQVYSEGQFITQSY